MQKIRPFIGSKKFYRDALKVMIPVTVQQLINTLFNMVDNLMVGSLDVNGLAMSAVTVANRPYTIFWGIFFGMSGAAGLMISQYFGAKDEKTCQGLFALQTVAGSVVALLVGLVLAFFPEQVMRIFVSDPRTVELGVKYLRIIWISYIPTALSNVFVYSTRAVGQNKVCMLVSMISMGTNALCNYVLIFGHWGLPAMGVEGAAIGTLIARVVEMCIYIVLLSRKRTIFTMNMAQMLRLTAGQIKTFVTRAIPLIFNEVLWTLGNNIFFWSYARISEASLPALTIGEQLAMIAYAMSMGTASAVAVLVGAELGANRFEQAKANCKKLLSLVVCIGLVCVVVCCAFGVILPNLFGITQQLRTLAMQITFVMGVFAPMNFVYSFCFFCLRAGGDTRNAMLLDSGYMWVLPVPAALLMAFFLPGRIALPLAVLVIQFLNTAKAFPALMILRKGTWVRNITEKA